MPFTALLASVLAAAVPVVPPAALPFDLREVRLLGGPLKQSQDLHAAYLLSLEPDRLLSRFRSEAGLTPKAPAYPGWESVELPGVGAGFYLSGCSRLWAVTGDPRWLARVTYLLAQLAECQQAQGNGYLLATKGGRQLFTEIEHGDIRHTGGWLLNGQPEPYYALEKLLSGLRDAWRVAGQAQALVLERALADWLDRHCGHLSDAQLTRLMACEFGGLNWVLADLYADTGERRYLALSRRWHDSAVLDPLSRGVDNLAGRHANTQFPKLCGLAARYPYTGDTADRVTAEFFWERVVHHHSYATGNNSLAEHFGPPDQLATRLGANTGENCNAWNMLRLTGLLYQLQPRAEYADFMERLLYNQILAAQHPADGRVCYFLSLQPGGTKHYEPLTGRFACCTCSGFDSYARHAEWLYAHSDDCLYVNLFAASSVRWRDKGLSVTQVTDFPDDERVRLEFTCDQPVRCRLALRCPAWTGPGFRVLVNGRDTELGRAPGNFVALDREWRTGDRVDLVLPLPLHAEPTPDHRTLVALYRGPLLLAGDLGDAGVPVLPADDRSLAQTVVDNRLGGVPLVPFHRLHDRRYTVYWERLTPAQLAEREQARAAELTRAQALDARTIDRVLVGDAVSEAAHNLHGDRTGSGRGAYGEHLETHWRHAQGWFSYDLRPPSGQPGTGQPLALLATYWGREAGARVFDVLVDGEQVGTTSLDSSRPAAFYDVTYPVPAALVVGKAKLTVTFKPHPGNTAGGLFGLRLVRAE